MPCGPILSSQPPVPASPAPPTAPASSRRRTDGQRGGLVAHDSKSGARISVHRCGLSDWPRRRQNSPNARATHTRRGRLQGGGQITVRIESQTRASKPLVSIGLRWAVSYPPHFKRQVAGGVSECPASGTPKDPHAALHGQPKSSTPDLVHPEQTWVGGAPPKAGR